MDTPKVSLALARRLDLPDHRAIGLSLLESTLPIRTCLCQPQVALVTASWSWLPGLCLWLEAWGQKFFGSCWCRRLLGGCM